jgi:hypothetical protein
MVVGMTDEQLDALVLRYAGLLTTGDGLRALAHAVAAAERERCAKLCEQWNATNPQRLAQAIREGT